uniref:Uncharacterized protein n=1 Tax=viral metagenome TaxID=1070528 RepID=A0A6M3MBC6_9ZZZZ
MIGVIAFVILAVVFALVAYPCFEWGVALLGRYAKWLEKKGWLPHD